MAKFLILSLAVLVYLQVSEVASNNAKSNVKALYQGILDSEAYKIPLVKFQANANGPKVAQHQAGDVRQLTGLLDVYKEFPVPASRTVCPIQWTCDCKEPQICTIKHKSYFGKDLVGANVIILPHFDETFLEK